MANAASWFIFALGIGHLVFGFLKFAGPVADALSAGFIGQFAEPEVRRTAFWFLIFGPLLMLVGQVGIHAVSRGDLALIKILGIYVFATAVLGVAAFPASPFWAPLVVAPVLIAVGYEWIPL